MSDLNTRLTNAVTQTETDSEKFNSIIHGDNTTEVSTDNGNVPSVAKAIKDSIQDPSSTALSTFVVDRNDAISSFNTNSAQVVTDFNTNSAQAVTDFNTNSAQAITDFNDAATGELALATTQKTLAETARTGAETAEAKAEDWAEENEDVEVETGLYSAKHHALKSAASASASAVSASTAETHKDTALQAATDALQTTVDNNEATVMGIVRPKLDTKADASALECDGVKDTFRTLFPDTPLQMRGGASFVMAFTKEANAADGFIFRMTGSGTQRFWLQSLTNGNLRMTVGGLTSFVFNTPMPDDELIVFASDGSQFYLNGKPIGNSFLSVDSSFTVLDLMGYLSIADQQAKGYFFGAKFFNFSLPTNASNPSNIPYTVEDASDCKPLPNSLRKGESVAKEDTTFLDSGTTTINSSDASTMTVNWTSSGSNNFVILQTSLEARKGGIYYIDLDVNENTRTGALFLQVRGVFNLNTYNNAGIFDDGGTAPNSFLSVGSTGNYKGYFTLKEGDTGDGLLDIRFFLGAASTGDCEITINELKLLGTVIDIDSENLKVPTGAKQLTDNIGNQVSIANGAKPTHPSDEGKYKESLTWVNTADSKNIVTSGDIFDADTFVEDCFITSTADVTLDIGDGNNESYYANDLVLTANTRQRVVFNKFTDGTNFEMLLKPTASFNGTITITKLRYRKA